MQLRLANLSFDHFQILYSITVQFFNPFRISLAFMVFKCIAYSSQSVRSNSNVISSTTSSCHTFRSLIEWTQLLTSSYNFFWKYLLLCGCEYTYLKGKPLTCNYRTRNVDSLAINSDTDSKFAHDWTPSQLLTFVLHCTKLKRRAEQCLMRRLSLLSS